MAQEFVIKSQAIEDKINQLLPSQGGFQPGVDFSASTMVMPIIDLTETAEGSQVREDLQKASSLNRSTVFAVNNSTATPINTTGYYEVIYTSTILYAAGTQISNHISVTDGITSKKIVEHKSETSSSAVASTIHGKCMIFLAAGDSITVTSGSGNSHLNGSIIQVADLSGNLTEVS